MTEGNEKTLATVVAELKQELTDFLQTRGQMFKSEIETKLKVLKLTAPMFVMVAVLLWVGFLLLTGALVVVIALGLGGTVGSFGLSLLIVGACYCVFAAITGFFAYKEFSSEGLAPKRTMRVLKQDQLWLRNEAKVQL